MALGTVIPAHGHGALTPWKPGRSGNPSGVSSAMRKLREEIDAAHCKDPRKVLDVLDRLRKIALGCEVEVQRDGDETVVAYVVTAVQVAAAKVYLDRVLGPPKESTVPPAAPALSPEEIRARIAQVVMADPAFREQMRAMLGGENQP